MLTERLFSSLSWVVRIALCRTRTGRTLEETVSESVPEVTHTHGPLGAAQGLEPRLPSAPSSTTSLELPSNTEEGRLLALCPSSRPAWSMSQ